MTVWQKSFKLLLKIYQITREFPAEEKFGIVSDMRCTANSVVHNISEGFGRYGRLDKTRFYKISRGSCYELISQIMASEALNFIDKNDKKDLLIEGYKEVISKLDSIIKTVEKSKIYKS